ncbi:hypothetical protein [Paracoccus cavernae]|uniref:hypothetical protein n=1 Tax=Paracoccus cavernae TaxID=1571207 RepID=UPI0035F3233A
MFPQRALRGAPCDMSGCLAQGMDSGGEISPVGRGKTSRPKTSPPIMQGEITLFASLRDVPVLNPTTCFKEIIFGHADCMAIAYSTNGQFIARNFVPK